MANADGAILLSPVMDGNSFMIGGYVYKYLFFLTASAIPAAALAQSPSEQALAEIVERDLCANVRAVGERLKLGLASLKRHGIIGDIRGKGLMCAVELVADRPTKQCFPAGDEVGPRIHQEAAGRGLFSRVKADTYVLAPPAVITDDQLDRTVEILSDSIHAALG